MESARVQAPEEAPGQAEPAALPRPTATLLDLQATAGNRAVVRLLRQTDPRLTWTQKAIDEGKGLDATKLPFTDSTNPDAGWDSQVILSRLTQIDESTETWTDKVRCGANCALAVAINRGPRDTIAWARAIMRIAYGWADDPRKDASVREGSRTLGDKVWKSIARMERAVATYGDLSNIAHHAKVILSNNPQGMTTGHEVAAMVGLLGGMQSSSTPMHDKKMFAQYVRDLKAGEAYIVLVDTDVLEHTTRTRNLDQANHYIVVGKDSGGKVFLYDPYPREGSQFIRSQDPSFWTVFENAEGDWKSTYIFARPKIR